jgi:hypothetical protein
MNFLKRLQASTPKKYKKWGKFFKWISGSLIAGMLAVNSVNLTITENFNIIIAGAIFITTAASTAFYAQVEDKNKEEDDIEK